jgi:putative tryptophan/tyrosine transport system permease protein
MFTAIFGAFESGLIYALMALGVYLSFRVLDFPDLTVDGSFVTGAAVAATMIVNGSHPVTATLAAILAGFLAGCMTGILHTKGKINALLSGILMMIALYSINLRIMGKSNVPLLQEATVMTLISDAWTSTGVDHTLNSIVNGLFSSQQLPKTWGILFAALIMVTVVKLFMDWLLKTEMGLALRAVGDNQNMIRSFSADTDALKIFGLGLSNAVVALSGALIAQYGGFADVGMGIGTIIIGLASVIIGEAIFGIKSIARTTAAVIGGAVIYRLVVALALKFNFLETGDMKLITAVIVIIALVIPKMAESRKERKKRKARLLDIAAKNGESRGEHIATIKADL